MKNTSENKNENSLVETLVKSEIKKVNAKISEGNKRFLMDLFGIREE